jgi:putative endopeptidase
MNFKFLFVLIMSVTLAFTSCSKKAEDKPIEPTKPAIDLANFDKNIKPGDDFFRYVNGGWMKNNPIPADESRWGAFNVLNLENQKKLRTLFEEAAIGSNKESDWMKIGDFYSSGMDTNSIEKQGIAPLKPFMDKIEAIKTIEDVQKVAGEFNNYGISTLFGTYAGADEKNSVMNIFNLYQGGLGLPDRDYYTQKDDRMKKIRDEYVKHLTKMFELSGQTTEVAAKSAITVMKLETQMATASRTRLDLRDPIKNYNKMPLADLQKQTPKFNWNLYLENLGVKNPADVNVGQPEFFVEISRMMEGISVDEWKTFLKWKLLNETADYLSKAFVEQNFAFYGKVLTGSQQLQDRWKKVLNTTSGLLGEAVGKIYVEKYFPPQAKQRMLKLVDNLKIALETRIKKLDWMSDVTKTKAVQKLSKMAVKIGYPDKWKDFTSLAISRDSYVMNVLNANKFLVADNLNKVNKPVDKMEWHMSPQTVNAYYSPNGNEIVFPAAILQPPFFYLEADDAVNYGAIGVVIGHEMTHGFDDQGRQYDADGNLTDWWTPEDASKFNEKVQILVNQFNTYTAIDSMKIDGKLTVGENIADLGGLTVSLEALRKAANNNVENPKIDDFTPLQRFFISYSQVWRQNIRNEELIKRLKEDVHSPGEFRVNGGLVNIPEFYQAFNVNETKKMFAAPDKRPIIW